MTHDFLSISGVSHFSKTFEDQGDASDINEVNKSANFYTFKLSYLSKQNQMQSLNHYCDLKKQI